MKQTRNKQKAFFKSVKEMTETIIQIGAVGQHADTDLSNNELLAVHEFTDYAEKGARAPITKTIENYEFRNRLNRTIKKLIEVNFDDKAGVLKAEDILNGIGLVLKNAIKKTILDGVLPDIEEETKTQSEPRRADVPLIATGQMFDSIEFGLKGA